MSKKSTLKVAIATATGIIANDKVQKALFGVYSDGTARSLPDCLEGEILSPKDREKMLYKNKDKKKSKKKKSKKKKMAKIDF